MVNPNVALVRRYIDDCFAAGDLSLVDKLYAPDYRNHTNPPGVPAGPQGVKVLLGAFREAFPDVAVKTHHVVADGDLVSWHVESTGTNKGPLMGAPATGRRATWRAMAVDRVVGGRIAERWEVFDVAGLMAQLSGK